MPLANNRPPVDKDEVVRLHIEEGLNLSEIALRMGVSRERTRQIVKQMTGEGSLWAKREAERMACKRFFDAVHYAAYRELHNQHNRYRYLKGCRCDICVEANRQHRIDLTLREPPNHGTASAYFNYACRCDACKLAGRLENAKRYYYRKKRI